MKLNKSASQESRRATLTKLLFGWTALIVLPSLYVIGKYLVPPIKRVGQISRVVAAKINEIPLNSARIVRLGNIPLILVHTESGEYKAFSATCTHLGCIVQYRGDRGGYFQASRGDLARRQTRLLQLRLAFGKSGTSGFSIQTLKFVPSRVVSLSGELLANIGLILCAFVWWTETQATKSEAPGSPRPASSFLPIYL